MSQASASTVGEIDLEPRGDDTRRIQLEPPTTRRLLVVGAALAILYSAAVVWVVVRAPDLGFGLTASRRIAAVWPGGAAAAAGLHRGDSLRAVGGVACGMRDCLARLAELRPGEEARLGVRRGDQQLEIRYLLPGRLPFKPAAGLLLGIFILVIALLADRGATGGAARCFYASGIVDGLLLVSVYSRDVIVLHQPLGPIGLAATLLAAPISCHFALLFPVPAARVTRRALALLYLPAAITLLAILTYHGGWLFDWRDRHPAFDAVASKVIFASYSLPPAVYLSVAALVCWRRFRRTGPDSPEYDAVRWSVAGNVGLAVVMAAGACSAAYDLERFATGGFATYLTLVVAIGAVSMLMQIVHHPLGELDRVLQKGAGHLVATVAAAAVYFVSVAVIGAAASSRAGDARVTLGCVLAAAALFGPVRHGAQRWLDRRFGRARSRGRQLLSVTAHAGVRTTDRERLAREVVSEIHQALALESAALYEEDAEGRLTETAAIGSRSLAGDARDPVRKLVVRTLGTRALHSLGGGGLVVGVPLAGPRGAALAVQPRPGTLLDEEQRELLQTLADGLALALERAAARAELERTTHELSRHLETLQVQRHENRRLLDWVETRAAPPVERERGEPTPLVGEGLRATWDRARRVADSEVAVLVRGETGTGKELLCHTIHHFSRRKDGPFVVVDCGALPDHLVESTLFGHERGAFTGAVQRRIGLFEAAAGGTLFLDEVAELPLSLQPKLLGAVERGAIVRVGGSTPIPIDVRVIAASHRRLADEVTAGRFRSDLFYRLAGVELALPPLRERSADIPALVNLFLDELGHRRGEPARRVSAEALAVLLEHDWPGNVRELKHTLEAAVLVSPGAVIEREAIGIADRVLSRQAAQRHPHAPSEGGLQRSLDDIERERIVDALRRSDGNRSHAAAALGMKRATLLRRMKRYGIT